MTRSRKIAVGTFVALAGLLTAACGSGGGGSKASPTPASGSSGSPTVSAAGLPKSFTLSIDANASVGGKNDQEAVWITKYVIPTFEQQMKAQGIDANVKFVGHSLDDAAFKSQLVLSLKSGSGPDIFDLDGIEVGEFATAGYIKPLDQVVGPEVNDWEGWSQIPKAVQDNMSFQGKRYGIPFGTDGRVIFFNKTLFTKAGLPTNWQPKSWQDILAAAQQIKQKLPGVTPIQLNAGTAMTEATTMQGFLPLLVGTGVTIYDPSTQKWQGDTPNVEDVLKFYQQIYSQGLGNKQWQLVANGRDQSFQAFSQNKVAMLIESDYFWRSVVNPNGGIDPMTDRNQVVGWALIPAMEPGKGIRGQDFVSMSGGGGQVINPNTKYPKAAWALLSFMHSKESDEQYVKLGKQPRILERTDVNKETLASDPLLSFIAEKVLPITAFRPSLAVYPQVSSAIQLATQQVVQGTSPQQAAQNYAKTLKGIVGSDHVTGS